jgi:hypothetical protein
MAVPPKELGIHPSITLLQLQRRTEFVRRVYRLTGIEIVNFAPRPLALSASMVPL